MLLRVLGSSRCFAACWLLSVEMQVPFGNTCKCCRNPCGRVTAHREVVRKALVAEDVHEQLAIPPQPRADPPQKLLHTPIPQVNICCLPEP